jgi:hypothetical protein
MRLLMPEPMSCRLGATLGLLACAAWSGCRPANPAQQRPLVVAISGDTAGWIVPCGCAANQSGGLPRRADCVASLRRQATVILADVGGAPSGTAAYDRLKFEAILRGEVAMGIAAHNIGQGEALLGPAYLRRVTEQLNVPLVSANVRDTQGRLVAEPFRIAEAAGRRVALTGVLAEQYATDQLQVISPHQAILDALGEAADRYDAVVVLAYLEDDALRRLVDMLPEADVVVGGPTGQPIAPAPIGPTLLASATTQGKFLARFDAPPPGASRPWTGAIVELDEHFRDDPQQMANLKQFYGQLAERDFTPRETSFANPIVGQRSEYRIAGNESCRECHAEDGGLWDLSRHAHAWDSLRKKGAHVDPDCQRCHVNGYGLPGGFASVARSPGSTGVGCESCHGPSAEHADDPEIRTAYSTQAKNRCVICHDRENSPHFVLDEYWTQIRHGTSPEVAAASGKTSEDCP